MKKGKKSKALSLAFIMLFMLLGTFELLSAISSTPPAPYSGILDADDFTDNGPANASAAVQTPDIYDDTADYYMGESPGISHAFEDLRHNEEDASTGEDDAGEEETSGEEDPFITVYMDESDIHSGSLILVNNDNAYKMPDEHELVNVAKSKTDSYRVSDSHLMLSDAIIGPLNDMMDDFRNETGRRNVTVISAFRDVGRQQEILDGLTATIGLSEAKKRASLPGHSEHHTGLAVDFGVYSDGEIGTFYTTGANVWFLKNAYKYGFIPRYPNDKTDITKISYEPWHFRYVGVPHAYYMYISGSCLEEYIEFIAGFTREKPYRVSLGDDSNYEVYFTSDTEIVIPNGCDYEISGNNIDGFIVTVKL